MTVRSSYRCCAAMERHALSRRCTLNHLLPFKSSSQPYLLHYYCYSIFKLSVLDGFPQQYSSAGFQHVNHVLVTVILHAAWVIDRHALIELLCLFALGDIALQCFHHLGIDFIPWNAPDDPKHARVVPASDRSGFLSSESVGNVPVEDTLEDVTANRNGSSASVELFLE